MKSLLVIVSVLGVAVAQHWGQPGVPQDTPEVAAAKAAHLAALARVNSQPQHQNWGQQQQQQNWNHQPQQTWNAQPKWNGPIALPPGLDANGAPLPVQDTPEVAAERARHFSLYSGGGHPSLLPKNQWNSAPQNQWNSAPQNQWNSAPQNQWNSAPAQRWNAPAPQWNAPANPQWNNPNWAVQPAQPAGLPADTPEVAAAKAAHLAAHAQIATAPQAGHGHGRWRRSLVLAAPAHVAYSAPIISSHIVAAPIVRSHLVATPISHVTTHVAHGQSIVHPSPIALAHW